MTGHVAVEEFHRIHRKRQNSPVMGPIKQWWPQLSALGHLMRFWGSIDRLILMKLKSNIFQLYRKMTKKTHKNC